MRNHDNLPTRFNEEPEKIIEKLNAKNNNKKNNGLDALIAETALKNKHVLVTDDGDLREVHQDMGGIAVSFQDFLSTNKAT